MQPARPNPFPPPAARRASFALSAGAALALNGLALAVVAAAAGPWQPGAAPPPQRVAWITSIGLGAPPAAASPAANPPLPADPPAPAKRPAPPRVATAQPPGPAATPVPASRVPDPSLATPLATTDSPPDTGWRFYDFAEVERPAEPDSDWNLDPAVLDSSGVQTLVFDIFIGPAGEVVGCIILSPTELAPETRQLLEERLRQTVARPALRDGMAVASVRRIEVSVGPPGS